MRIRPLAGLGERGFSFDLVSRRKAAQAQTLQEDAPEPMEPEAIEPEVAEIRDDHPPAQERAPLNSDDLTVEPFENVLQQLRGALAIETDEDEGLDAEAAEPAAEVQADPETGEDAQDEDAPLQLLAPEPAPQPARDTGASILRLLPENAVRPEPAPAPIPAADAPAAELSSAPRRGSRVKTTFLGFDRSDGRLETVFSQDTAAKVHANRSEFPFGWVIIIKGPGRGTSIAIGAGVSQIGRGDDQAVQLDFGDTSISRENHAAIAFDDEERKFYIGQGGKANIVRLNGRPVLSTEVLSDGDLIRIGETTMAFVAFCGEDFVWEAE